MKAVITSSRCLLAVFFACCLLAKLEANTGAQDNLQWINAESLIVEGRGWAGQTEHFYDRLPASAKGRVRDAIWNLGRDSSGMVVPFTTNSTTLSVRWAVRKTALALPHMPATGVSGVDLYMRDGDTWRWAAAGRPKLTGTSFSATLLSRLPATQHQFLLYLPLYNALDSLEIGIEPGAEIKPIVRSEKPIVFYGTSITQGACASRPGMAYTAILGRRLDMPVVNLGFSGNGRMEPEAMLDIAGLETPSVFVIDTLPNMRVGQIDMYEAGLALIRKHHPQVPIVMVSNVESPASWVNSRARDSHQGKNADLKKLFERLSASDANLYFVEPAGLLGDDGEATVDGSHPNDMGFVRIADHVEPVLRKALGK